jgi:hypothetical protein
VSVRSKHYFVAQQTGLISVINSAMAKTSSSNPAAMADETVTARRSTRNKTAEQGGGGGVTVPPGRQHVDQSLRKVTYRKAPPETMPTLVALQRPPALPPIGPPPPYPRRTN